MFVIFGLCSGLAAFALLVGAAWSYFKQQRTMQSRVPTNGVVVELAQRPGNRGYVYCPVVEFSVPSGEKITFTSEFGSRPASHQIGQMIAVRYDSADPQNAEIESGLSLWLFPLIMVFMGAIACCLSVSFIGIYLAEFSP